MSRFAQNRSWYRLWSWQVFHFFLSFWYYLQCMDLIFSVVGIIEGSEKIFIFIYEWLVTHDFLAQFCEIKKKNTSNVKAWTFFYEHASVRDAKSTVQSDTHMLEKKRNKLMNTLIRRWNVEWMNDALQTTNEIMKVGANINTITHFNKGELTN